MKNNLVSVIITTKNEESNIENCLKSIICQTYKHIEIIIVDNGSTDKTKEIAKKYTNLVYDKGPERSAQRNYGVSISKGEYILYIDADMILGPFVVESCINEIITDDKVIGLYIKEVILGKGLWSRVRRFERSFYCGTPIDAVRFVQKEAFLEVGGFDESMSGPEDWDLDRRLSEVGKLKMISDSESFAKTDNAYNNVENLTKWHNTFDRFLEEKGVTDAVLSERNILFHNESEFNLKKYMAKKRVYSRSFSQYISKWGNNDSIIRKQFGIPYRYFIVFLENGKWKRLLSRPFLTMGMYFLRVMVGIEYLKSRLVSF